MNTIVQKHSMQARIIGLCAVLLSLFALTGLAHTPLLYLEDNGDGTIYIEAGFSDGSSGAGMIVRLEDEESRSLWESVLDDFGAAESVPIPEVQPYYVVFVGGPGHEVRKEGIYASAEPVETAASPTVASAAPAVESSTETGSVASSAPQHATPSVAGTASAWDPAATLGAGWSMAESTATDQPPYATVLWVIAGLLAFIALQLALVAFGMAFFAGTRFRSRVV